ncbi:MAG: hypothetical protein ACKOWF_18200 [Chloroflexota bacterium]
MDQSSFDRIARLLGGAASRRAGLRAALGALTGLAAGDALAKPGHGAPAEKARTGAAASGRRAKPAGPCGDGSGAANQCRKDKDCCTGYCKLGKTGKSGRCRCLKRGKPCTARQTCCGGAPCTNGTCPRRRRCLAAGAACTPKSTCCGKNVCVSGVCKPGGPVPVATGKACDPDADTCADAAASCIGYDSDDPEGTFCVLPTGTSCAGNNDCFSQDCDGSVCKAIVCDVCADPLACTYQDLESAVQGTAAGGRIRIAPGTWDAPATMLMPKSLRFEACGGVPGVIMKGSGNFCLLDTTDGISLTVKNIEFQHDKALSSLCANTVSAWATRPTITAIGCTFPSTVNVSAVSAYGPVEITVTDCILDGTNVEALIDGGGSPSTLRFIRTVQKNLTATYGFNIENDVALIMTDCEVANNIVTGQGAGISAAAIAATAACSVTLAGTTEIIANSASNAGGGILLGLGAGSLSLTMTDTSSITANSAPQASGIGVDKTSATGTITVTGASTRVSGNTVAPDQCAYTINSGANWIAVADCESF